MPEPVTISAAIAAAAAEIAIIIEKLLEASSAISKMPTADHVINAQRAQKK